MGFDTLSEIECPQGSFLPRVGPGRIFLTRTQRMAGAIKGCKTILIQANDPEEQVAELIRKAPIRREDVQPFSRCILCNERIVAVAKHAVLRSVPDYVWHTHTSFSTCPKCGRVYWKGSHTERASQRLLDAFQASGRPVE
jgi:uncharacterized protein